MKELNLKSLCRICARKAKDLKSMFESADDDFLPQFSLVDVFTKLTRIKISEDDQISYSICKRCRIVLTSAVLLSRLALATDHKLKVRLKKQSKLENEVIKLNEHNFIKQIGTKYGVDVSKNKSDNVIDMNDYEKRLFAKYFPKTAESMKDTSNLDKSDILNTSDSCEIILNHKTNAKNTNDKFLTKNNELEKQLFIKYFPENAIQNSLLNNESLERYDELNLFKKYFPESYSDRDKFETLLFNDSSRESTFCEDYVSNADSYSPSTDETCKLNVNNGTSTDSTKHDVQNSKTNDYTTETLDQNVELCIKNYKEKSVETLDVSKNKVDFGELSCTSGKEIKTDESDSTDKIMRNDNPNTTSKVIDRDKIEKDVMTLLRNGYLYVRKGKKKRILTKNKAKKPYNFENQSSRYKSILVGPYKGADVPAQCKICKKVLATIRSLKKHAQVHFGFTHICEYCGHGFRTYAAMDAHMMARHGKEKKFVCQYCQHRACSKHELHEHELSHTGVRPYICDMCGNNFARRPCLVKHIGRIHTAIKSFKCDECGKQFFSSADLRNHDNSIHMRRFMYECEQCGARYAKRASVRQHLAGAHGVPRETQGHVRRVCVL